MKTQRGDAQWRNKLQNIHCSAAAAAGARPPARRSLIFDWPQTVWRHRRDVNVYIATRQAAAGYIIHGRLVSVMRRHTWLQYQVTLPVMIRANMRWPGTIENEQQIAGINGA